MPRPLAYLAGPMSVGCPTRLHNAAVAFQAMTYLWEYGVACYVPNVSEFVSGFLPGMGYEDWMELDVSIVSKCDVLIRLPGHSIGADREVAFARSIGVPVVMSSELTWQDLCREAVDLLKARGKL